MNQSSSTAVVSLSLREAGLTKLNALCDVLNVSSVQRREAHELFDEISQSWGHWDVGDAPLWTSDITDDGTPFEFSVAFERNRFELRMLFESQQRPLGGRSTWDAAVNFGQWLRSAGKADLSQFDLVADIFKPNTRGLERFSLWHAAVLRDHSCMYKVYFNPELDDPNRAYARVDAALERLGFAAARRFVDRCTQNISFRTRVPYFSLDLEPRASARAKIYLSADSVEHALAIVAQSGALDPAACVGWLEKLIGTDEPPPKRPILVCGAFRHDSTRPDVTVHVPIRCFVNNDNEAVERLNGLLPTAELARLPRILQAVSGRPPSSTRGVLTYASLRQSAGALRVTGYLAPQLYVQPIKAISGTHSRAHQSG